MSTAEQWAGVLGAATAKQFTLQFDGLGLEAQCRSLDAGEVEECVRMGGERGLRYALYLACDELREAGESLRKQGALDSAFDITLRLGYGDVLAAGRAVLQQSGAGEGRVRLDGGVQSEEPWSAETPLPPAAAGMYPLLWHQETQPEIPGWVTAGQVAREFADRLWAAAGNR